VTAKILIVEDDERLIRTLEATLKGEGFEVIVAHDGIEALRAMQVERPDVVLVNARLPWLREAQPRQEKPAAPQTAGPAVVVVSGKDEASERARALATGADDYVAVPFEAKDLLGRIKVARQRKTSSGMLRAGPMEMDLIHGTVAVEGRHIALSAKEFELLRKLLEARGRVVTRAALRETVWEHDDAHRPDTRTVDVHIGRLRRKLGSAGRYIITVRGTGYRCFARLN
jgi:DNA-binding response OmpR family regulator